MEVIIFAFLALAVRGGADGENTESNYRIYRFRKPITHTDIEVFAKNGTHIYVAVTTKKCQHCKDFIRRIEDINDELGKIMPSLTVYYVDINHLSNTMKDSLKVTSFPSIYLFLGNLNGILFDLERTADKLAEFYKRVSSVVVDRIENGEELKKFQDSAYAAVLFVTDEELTKNHMLFHIARENYNVHFGYTLKHSEVALKFKNWINVFRNGELRSSSSPEKNIDEMQKYIKVQTHPSIFHFPADSYAISSLFEDNYLFYIDNLAGVAEATSWLKKIGDELRGSYVVLLSDYSDPTADRALRYFGVVEGDPGRIRLIVRSKDMFYKMEEDTRDPISEQTLRAWLEKFEKGGLKPFLKSEKLPEDWDKQPLKTLVGTNYAEVANDVSKHVFILLYIPGDKPNDYTLESFAKLAEIFASFDDVVIAKIDVQTNDIPHEYLRVHEVPATRFYPKGEKKELQYTGVPHVDELTKFLEENTGYVVKSEEGEAASQKTKGAPKEEL